MVSGYIEPGNVVAFLQWLSLYIDHPHDDLDQVALAGALKPTDSDDPAAWFEYPLAGTPDLLVRMAREVGSVGVHVEVVGEIDPVLTARIETLMDVYW
ncbi:hypothetical protein GCM10010435_90550 [Winogradskya consettensis]|uniref:Uncharacterized protein n=2 Tax=Winogradskya TaxID=3240235 RepID=A0A919SWU8_9ACTN|nr:MULTISPECIES: hypothetical protein [Actinoplanes]GIE18945.1 hypothetical protein Ahu01nite_020470 [Actinoplanes humidus]GIM79957.1 hypothetical protein Aco04nite_68180 [Actinoplanes consettensis]